MKMIRALSLFLLTAIAFPALSDTNTRRLTVGVSTAKSDPALKTTVRVSDGGRIVAAGSCLDCQPVELMMPADMKLWSPESPAIYDLDIEINSEGKTADHVRSYVAMRKVSTSRGADGIDLGPSALRKYMKVEAATWCTYCDRKGILVWLDMPNGDRWAEWNKNEVNGLMIYDREILKFDEDRLRIINSELSRCLDNK